MAFSGHEPADDGSSHLEQTMETETAWGRSRFTEAEIKKAFELRDHELRRAEEEAATIAASNAANKKGGNKADQKRAQEKKDEARRKEEAKAKKKDEAKKKKDGLDDKDGGSDLEDTNTMDTAEQDAWNALLTYNFSQDAQELASLIAEQKKAESFEDWSLVTPGTLTPVKLSQRPVFESHRYQVRSPFGFDFEPFCLNARTGTEIVALPAFNGTPRPRSRLSHE